MEEQASNSNLELYLDGKLKGEELAAFEKELASDAALQDAVALHQEALLLLQLDEKENIKALVNKVRAAEHPKKRKSVVWMFSVAATVALLLTVAFYFNWSYSNEQLYASNFEVYPDVVTTMGAGTSAMDAGMEAYLKEDYDLAIELFSANELRDSATAQLYKAVSELALGKYTDAQNTLYEFPNNEEHGAAIAWYHALAHLGDAKDGGNVDHAKAYLKTVVALGPSPFYDKAQALLEDLDHSVFR